MPISSSSKKRLVVTMGDPAGVGPEVIIKALSDKRVNSSAYITVIGDYFVLDRARKFLKSKTQFSLKDLSNVPSRDFSFGRSEPSYGKASMEYLDAALDLIKSGGADALVTAPVNKECIRISGAENFQGHTEYLAAKSGVKNFAMMFVGKKLKVSLVTRHIAIKDVPASLSEEGIYNTIILTYESLKKNFSVTDPRIAVAGLNPHAGDHGIFGDEEKMIISPAVRRASVSIKTVYGPVSPDAVFYEALNGRYDAVVAMYHDQALAPFKALYFFDGVNLTLGLPFVRTSPDHGTAFDIAGKGLADAGSMKEAILLAGRLAGNAG